MLNLAKKGGILELLFHWECKSCVVTMWLLFFTFSRWCLLQVLRDTLSLILRSSISQVGQDTSRTFYRCMQDGHKLCNANVTTWLLFFPLVCSTPRSSVESNPIELLNKSSPNIFWVLLFLQGGRNLCSANVTLCCHVETNSSRWNKQGNACSAFAVCFCFCSLGKKKNSGSIEQKEGKSHPRKIQRSLNMKAVCFGSSVRLFLVNGQSVYAGKRTRMSNSLWQWDLWTWAFGAKMRRIHMAICPPLCAFWMERRRVRLVVEIDGGCEVLNRRTVERASAYRGQFEVLDLDSVSVSWKSKVILTLLTTSARRCPRSEISHSHVEENTGNERQSGNFVFLLVGWDWDLEMCSQETKDLMMPAQEIYSVSVFNQRKRNLFCRMWRSSLTSCASQVWECKTQNKLFFLSPSCLWCHGEGETTTCFSRAQGPNRSRWICPHSRTHRFTAARA